jgi:hypothetical protein
VTASVLGWVTLYGTLYVAIALALGLVVFRTRDFQ